MKVGLIDLDGKLPNLALMKIASYHKALGDTVALNDFDVDKLYCSVIFARNKQIAEELKGHFPEIAMGGTGWGLSTKLPQDIHNCQPDYTLYSPEFIYERIKRGIGLKANKLKKAEVISNAGIGFTSRGCIRKCGFCVVPKAEGQFRQESEIKDLINPNSNVLILLDNNLTADPDVLDKLKEIKERNLIVDITQGIDVRLLTPEIAKAFSEIRHLRTVHYAWDLMNFERPVLEGIKLLSRHVKAYRQMCFMLVGYDTEFEEDMYRFKILRELKVNPYVMIYNNQGSPKLKHFARWVNGRIYKACEWNEYSPWIKEQAINL